ncbi:hypothetical protein DUT67_04965 [Pectobacterium peruviense]|nr:hypothetical protein [Pectobacterium peruviense]
MIHPFREINGRSQHLLFEHVIINCDYGVSFKNIDTRKYLLPLINRN